MKIIRNIAMLFCLLLILAACDIVVRHGANQEVEANPGIIGTWYNGPTKEMYAFSSDRSCKMFIKDDSSNLGVASIAYEISGDSINLYNNNGQLLNWFFIYGGGDNFIDTLGIAFERVEKNGVVGIWHDRKLDSYYVFNSDASGIFQSSADDVKEFTYTTAGDSIRITISGYKPYSIFQKGDTLEWISATKIIYLRQ